MEIDRSRPVLITGCSTGIGRATAVRLLAGGWTVYATARKTAAIDDLAKRGAKTLALDVTDEASMSAAVAQVEADGGAIGALVNNAGYSQSGAVESVSIELARKQLETNVIGLMRMCQLVLPKMRSAGSGRIVNLSSMGGKVTFPGGGVYHASKHAVEALSDALRWELAGFGIDVVVIEPGVIKTSFGGTAVSSIQETDPGSPYTAFNVAVAALTAGAYKGSMSALLGGSADRVASKIERAISSGRPRPRYRVTPSAGMFIGMRRLLTDRGWDRLMAAIYPRPTREG